MLTEKAKPRDYLQLATVGAYLVEEKPEWLPLIATAASDGETLEQALMRCGVSLSEFEKAWLEWGRTRFSADSRNLTHVFERPREFQL